MKNLYKIWTAGILMMFAACSKSFIQLLPESTVTVDVLYKTDKDFQDAVIECYDVFQAQYQSFWQFGDLRADDVKNENVAFIGLIRMDNFTLDNSDNVLRTTWQNYYRAIYRINNILQKIEVADTALVKNKKRHVGEAKFLRALAYFDLVRIFGDVPMLTTPADITRAYGTPREKVQTIYDQVIIPDLLEAETALAAKYTGSDVGRATSGAARSVLGKVYLTLKDFAKAETKLRQVTTMGYALLPNFKDLFDYTKDEHHSEYIFDIEYEEGINEGSSLTNQLTPNDQKIARFFGVIGDLGEGGYPTDNIFAAFETGDLRKDVSVAAKGVYDASGAFITLAPNVMQAFTRKYMYPLKANNDSKVNWKVVRYADVLLMYAEALNENGKTADAVPYLNQVHKRAGLQPFETTLPQADIRQKIAKERRVELYMEGHRWFDLLRTGLAASTMAPYGMKPHMTLFPIPLSQIQLINNPAVLPQNPGY